MKFGDNVNIEVEKRQDAQRAESKNIATLKNIASNVNQISGTIDNTYGSNEALILQELVNNFNRLVANMKNQ